MVSIGQKLGFDTPFTDDEGVFVGGPLGPRVQIEAVPDVASDPVGEFEQNFPDSPLLILKEDRREEFAEISPEDFLGGRFRDDEGNLTEDAKERGLFGSITHEVSSGVAGGATGAAAGASEGVFDGLFGDLRNAGGTLTLVVVGLVALLILTPLSTIVASVISSD